VVCGRHLDAIDVPFVCHELAVTVELRVGGRILTHVESRIASARTGAHVVVHPKLQTHSVNRFAQRGDPAREARLVCTQVVCRRIAAVHVAVVDVEPIVARGEESLGDKGCALGLEEFGRYARGRVRHAVLLATEALPRHPAHRWLAKPIRAGADGREA
jgi:hypothetical protein